MGGGTVKQRTWHSNAFGKLSRRVFFLFFLVVVDEMSESGRDHNARCWWWPYYWLLVRYFLRLLLPLFETIPVGFHFISLLKHLSRHCYFVTRFPFCFVFYLFNRWRKMRCAWANNWIVQCKLIDFSHMKSNDARSPNEWKNKLELRRRCMSAGSG